VTPLEKTVCSLAFIAYRSGIRFYRLREETRAAETRTGPGSSAASSGTRSGTGTRTCAETRACEAGKEVMYRGIYQLMTLLWPPSGGLFFGKERHDGTDAMPCSGDGPIILNRAWNHGSHCRF
jgi:hypothetical protein